MTLLTSPLPVALGLLFGLLVLLEVGRRFGNGSNEGFGTIDGAVFGLMGLLVAFTFAGAAGRFEARRDLITQEANAIGTAWLRIDLVPSAAQPAMRASFRDYLDARLATYRALPDVAAATRNVERATALQGEIWTAAVAATQGDQRASMLLVPALNDMFDLCTTRLAAMRNHPPTIVFVLLVVVSLTCAGLAGNGIANRDKPNWLHMITFAVVLALSVFVILDLEFPRVGFIRIDAADQILVELRQSMH